MTASSFFAMTIADTLERERAGDTSADCLNGTFIKEGALTVRATLARRYPNLEILVRRRALR